MRRSCPRDSRRPGSSRRQDLQVFWRICQRGKSGRMLGKRFRMVLAMASACSRVSKGRASTSVSRPSILSPSIFCPVSLNPSHVTSLAGIVVLVDQSFPRLPVANSSLLVTRSVDVPSRNHKSGLDAANSQKKTRADLCHHKKCGNGVNRMKVRNASSNILKIHAIHPSCQMTVNRSSFGSSMVVSSLLPRAFIGPPFGNCAYPAFRLLQIRNIRRQERSFPTSTANEKRIAWKPPAPPTVISFAPP